MWWDQTIARWRGEGLPTQLREVFDIHEYFGLDPYRQFWFSTTDASIEAEQHHVAGIISNMDDYIKHRGNLFPDHSEAIEGMKPWIARQKKGEALVWISLEGFFWFPRTLMGFTKLMLAFYDQPELLHAINRDLLDFNLRVLGQMEKIGCPTFMTIAEDMSYNNGPMISRDLMDEYMTPYYAKMVARAKEMGICTIVDTDGDVTLLVPWLLDNGADGVLPLERQAGVDGTALREQFPDLGMVGHYDKMVMNKGEAAIRREFERLRPLMRSGGFIPSVDHQTPPSVSLEEYRTYLRILAEYV
ncbi:MAG: uroporphyrinogen decarboxylase family protein [Candidatus Latescibacterota bacterium]